MGQKKRRCYNCKFGGNQFKINKLTHLHCKHDSVHEENPNPWHSLKVFNDSCDLHEMKAKEGDKKWEDGFLYIYHIRNDHDMGWIPASEPQLYKEIAELKAAKMSEHLLTIALEDEIAELKGISKRLIYLVKKGRYKNVEDSFYESEMKEINQALMKDKPL